MREPLNIDGQKLKMPVDQRVHKIIAIVLLLVCLLVNIVEMVFTDHYHQQRSQYPLDIQPAIAIENCMVIIQTTLSLLLIRLILQNRFTIRCCIYLDAVNMFVLLWLLIWLVIDNQNNFFCFLMLSAACLNWSFLWFQLRKNRIAKYNLIYKNLIAFSLGWTISESIQSFGIFALSKGLFGQNTFSALYFTFYTILVLILVVMAYIKERKQGLAGMVLLVLAYIVEICASITSLIESKSRL